MPNSYITAAILLLSTVPAHATESEDTGPPPSNVQAYQCDGLDFTVEIKTDEAWVFLPDFSGALPRVESASGSKYEANNIIFWSKGEEASLRYGNKDFKNCRNNPALAVWEKAKLSGVDFRAVGNEPGWVLEIRGDELWLFQDYGATETHIPQAEQHADPDSATTTYRAQADGKSLSVTLKGESCQDTMVDETYETTVTVDIDGQVLHGCGKALH